MWMLEPMPDRNLRQERETRPSSIPSLPCPATLSPRHAVLYKGLVGAVTWKLMLPAQIQEIWLRTHKEWFNMYTQMGNHISL